MDSSLFLIVLPLLQQMELWNWCSEDGIACLSLKYCVCVCVTLGGDNKWINNIIIYFVVYFVVYIAGHKVRY